MRWLNLKIINYVYILKVRGIVFNLRSYSSCDVWDFLILIQQNHFDHDAEILGSICNNGTAVHQTVSLICSIVAENTYKLTACYPPLPTESLRNQRPLKTEWSFDSYNVRLGKRGGFFELYFFRMLFSLEWLNWIIVTYSIPIDPREQT